MKTKLTKAQRRMRVIKDAIAQIKLNTYVARSGDYVVLGSKLRSKILMPGSDALKNPDESMQKILQKLPKKACNVCAQGAIFLSFIRLENKVTVGETVYGEWSYSDKIVDTTKSLFTSRQLYLIEQYFELWNAPQDNLSLTTSSSIIGWYQKQAIFKKYFGKTTPDEDFITDNDEMRLLAILENMMKHNGLFKP